MPPALNRSGPPPLPRLRQIQLLKALALEAGWRHLAWLSGLSSLSSLLDIAGLGLAVTLLLGSGSRGLILGLPMARSLRILVGLILHRFQQGRQHKGPEVQAGVGQHQPRVIQP